MWHVKSYMRHEDEDFVAKKDITWTREGIFGDAIIPMPHVKAVHYLRVLRLMGCTRRTFAICSS